jgi:hypothetical protein
LMQTLDYSRGAPRASELWRLCAGNVPSITGALVDKSAVQVTSVLVCVLTHMWLQVPSMEWCFGQNSEPQAAIAEGAQVAFKDCKALKRAAVLYVDATNKTPFFRQDPATQPRGPLQLEFFGRPQQEPGPAGEGDGAVENGDAQDAAAAARNPEDAAQPGDAPPSWTRPCPRFVAVLY